MNTIEKLKAQIEILSTAKASDELRKSANGIVADIAYQATMQADKNLIEYFKNLSTDSKALVKGSWSKGSYVGNASLDKAIPEDIQKDAVLTIYNKLKKLEKASEASKAEQRLQTIKENQALTLVFPNPEELSQFLKENKGNNIERDAINQGLALMAEQESLERNAKEFIELEEKIYSLSEENLHKLNILIQGKLSQKKKKAA